MTEFPPVIDPKRMEESECNRGLKVKERLGSGIHCSPNGRENRTGDRVDGC
jgi:hypothetical protein